MQIVAFIVLWLTVAGVQAGPTSVTRHQLWFNHAERALAKGDREKFQAWVTKLGDYPLVPYLHYRYYLKYPDAVDEINRYLERYAATRYVKPVRIRLLEHLARQESWRDYLWYYRDLGKTELHCHYAWALYRQGRVKQAWRETQRLWLVGRSQPKACDRIFKVWKESGHLTTELVWRRFELALENNKSNLAKYLANSMNNEERKRALFWLKVHHHPKKYLCATWPAAFQGDGEIFADGLRQLARQDREAALQLWEQDANRFKLTPEQISQIQRFIGLRLAWRHDPRAWDWLSAVSKPFRDPEVTAWRVRVALREEHWSRALNAIEDMPAIERRDAQWRYWRARALEEMYGTETARPEFVEVAENMDFYGFLAADRLQGDYRIAHDPITVSEQTVQELEKSLTFRAIREFIALDRYWDARREWWYLLKYADREKLLAAAVLARRMGWPQMAIFAVAKAEHWNDLDIRFPVRFLDQVRNYAKTRNVDPAYIFGIIRRESAFDEHANSPVGARGLMQLMPYTARKVARQLRERLRTVKALEDSATNVRYGTAYFSSLLEKFDGHFVLATAAYNAGPHRVDRWLPTRFMPADIWIETIPFRETRRYVRAVLAYAMIYQKRLGQPSRRLSAYTTPIPGVKRRSGKANMHICRSSS